jgi:DNA-binding GntR family transcriptional regulator
MPAQLVKLAAAPDLVERVYRALLDAISDGSLAPGARITQEDIAAQLAVSRQPVLLALRMLRKDGFVHDAPGRGVLVAPLDVQWMRCVYAVRGALDALAARLAAARRFELDAAVLERGRKAARGRNIQAMIDADLAFHQAIYDAADNPLIGQLAAQHWRHLRRVMGAVLQSSNQRTAVWDEHAAIAEAIAAGQAERAAALIEQHSQQASRDLSERLTRVLQRTSGDTP